MLVLADIKKKHSSHAITADLDIAETAAAAELFRADGVIVTGYDYNFLRLYHLALAQEFGRLTQGGSQLFLSKVKQLFKGVGNV